MSTSAVAGAGAAPATAIPRDAFRLAAAIFLIVSTTNILTPLLPDIRRDFDVSISTAGVIVGSYGFARLMVDLPAGFITDRVGHRRLSVLAFALLVGACLVGLNAANVETLVAARIGSGAAVGILSTVALSALSGSAGAGNRGKVMSLFHVANNTAIAAFPILGGLVGAAFGWRMTFAVTIGLVLVAAVLLLPPLGRVRASRSAAGAGSAATSRVLHGRRQAVAIAATNIGVAANMINRHGFRNTVLPLYAATVLGLSGLSIASAIALMSIAGLCVATPGGMLGDRIGRRRIIVTGLAAVAVGDLAFLLTGDLWTFLFFSALIGFGDFFSSSQTALLAEIVPPERRTAVLAGYRFSSDLGALVGPVVLAAVMDLGGAHASIIVAAAILALSSLVARLGVPSTVDA